ncbi:MAG: tRNA uracil 4-sulfurtransferase ThiI [Euryarchaeota archaeon]|nr:tRNA uracil 4-sulfurtransferase ThiI [Euryarchaeota archaeon]
MQVVMIRYGELFLKSEPVMRYYINILINNLKRALDSKDLTYKIEVFRGRILIEGENQQEIAEAAGRIFGIVGVSVCTRTSNDLSEVETEAKKMAVKTVRPGMTFAVRVRRTGVLGFTSQELAASIGSSIYDEVGGLTVDLKNPDYLINIEVREWGALIYDTAIDGAGGLPVGTQGRVLSLLSAGIDSPVATWLMLRRGCPVTHLHLDGGRFMGPDTHDMVFRHHKTLSTWTPGTSLRMIVADMEPFYRELTEIPRLKNRCIICKRFMLRTATEIAKTERALALVMGDNIGQVASQTLVNMGVIESVLPPGLPLIQPLITYEKQETVDIARRIGTFVDSPGDLSCNAVPKHPDIAASLESILKDEEKMDIENLLAGVVDSARLYIALNGEIREK